MTNRSTPQPNLLLRFAPTLLAGPLLLLATPTLAQTNVTKDTVISPGAPLDNYRVMNGATLTGNDAKLLYVDVESGASLVLNDAQVDPGSRGAIGVALVGANASLNRTTVTAAGRAVTATVDSAGRGSLIQATDSILHGGNRGAVINDSRLELERSELRGLDANSVGAEFFNGTLVAKDSSVSGGQNGVRMREAPGAVGGVATLVLDNSLVEGRDGSAVVVGRGAGRPTSAQIEVRNGAELRASNGVLLEVADSATATLRVSDSNTHLVGDVRVAQGGNASVTLEHSATLTGRLDNVERLAVDSGAQWVTVGDSTLANLAMAGGSVRFGNPGDFHTLSVDNLSGNGTFIMEGNFATGQADLLNITGSATGEHTLRIDSSGTDPVAESSLHVVHAANGDARFALEGGPVDLGTFSYDLVSKENTDWYLDLTTRKVSPAAGSVLALFNSAPTVWYGELGSLRSRMGEVRQNSGKAGGWIRTFGNKYNVSAAAGVAYQQAQQGFSFGADTPLPIGDGNWLAGVTAGYSSSELNLDRGTSANVDSYHLGAYTTWLDPQNGYYFDAAARVNRYENSSDVRLSDGQKTKGKYNNHGVGVSLEGGRHLKFDQGYFVEPFAQLSALVIEGKDYDLDNGMRAEGGNTQSVLGKLGTTVGRTYNVDDARTVQPYVRMAWVHEFANDNAVKVNGNHFNNNLSGSRGEVGVGVAVAWADKWQAHADFDYSNGEKLEQPWGVNLGVRYNW
ncbi:outer membrane autotransporter barrel domain-containing protein [Pseudomonas sp. PAGU 2196]|uniref:autotransporter outer membrane beta-barrel domain-containing protein n=1 Tax=Pseudomonas sp. PAGU 2196 TaxID=2793997 RepID=UPI001EE02237|nr:autotransporter outer membrane beta-barrel domain-containing protein [Pseudomonas sp. PAGU 2196]GHS83252.1 outer membrane autotransporter barrel domain-containing protein [Pseudomonas sp. PAGU 2196]